MTMQIPMAISIPMQNNKAKLSKSSEVQRLTTCFIETLGNELEGIDPLIRTKVILSTSTNLNALIQSISIGDEIKPQLQNSRIKISALQHSIDQIDGHLTLLSEYIKTENKKLALEKIEKLFKIKDSISININSLLEMNKLCFNYCYSLWGYSSVSGNGANDLYQCYHHQGMKVNESTSSCSVNNSSMSLKRKEFNNSRNEVNRKHKTTNNSKSPACLYLKDINKPLALVTKSNHNNTNTPASSLFIHHRLNTSSHQHSHTNNNSKSPSSENCKVNTNSNSNSNSHNKSSSPIGIGRHNIITTITANKVNRNKNKELNRTKQSITLSNSSLCYSNKNIKDSQSSIPFSDDTISFYQNKIKELIKEVEKINESLIEEKSINTDLKTELNKIKESNCNSTNDNNNNSSSIPSLFQKELHDIKSIYTQSLTERGLEIKELKQKIESLSSTQRNASDSLSSTILFASKEKEANELQSALNKDIRELKDALRLKDIELHEAKELYQSDIQSKLLIESLLKSELQSNQKTYEMSLSEYKDTISKLEHEIRESKQKQSSNELSLINQLKLNHQKNITQLKELYTQSIGNKNEAIDTLTKQYNSLKSSMHEHPLSIRENMTTEPITVNREEIVKSFKEELAKLQNQIEMKESAIQNYESNMESICKKAIDDKMKAYDMEKLLLKQNEYEIGVLNEKMRKMFEENDVYRKQINELLDQVNELEVKEKELLKQMDLKDNEVLDLTTSVFQMEKKVEIKEGIIEELQVEKRDLIDQFNEYKKEIEGSHRKQNRVMQIISGVNKITLLPVTTINENMNRRIETYAFCLLAKRTLIDFKINTSSLLIQSDARKREVFDIKTLVMTTSNNNIDILSSTKDKEGLKIDRTVNTFSINRISKTGELRAFRTKTEFSIISTKAKVFENKTLKKFSNYVLIKPTEKCRISSINTNYFSIQTQSKTLLFSKEKLNLEYRQLEIQGAIRSKFNTLKTTIADNEIGFAISSIIKTIESNSIIDNTISINIEALHPIKVDNQDHKGFSTETLVIDNFTNNNNDDRQYNIVNIVKESRNESKDSENYIIVSPHQFDLSIQINEPIIKRRDCFVQYGEYKPITLESFVFLGISPFESKIEHKGYSLEVVTVQNIFLKPMNKEPITLSISQSNISLPSIPKTLSLIITQSNENSFNIISSLNSNTTVKLLSFETQLVISLQLLKSKRINSSKHIQTQSPLSSKYNKEEEEEEKEGEDDDDNDEESEYSEDNEVIDRLKTENTKLQTDNKTLKAENDALNTKLAEIEEVMNQEKEEFVGHIRLAFEKLIVEIQITTKAKDYITTIFRMLGYSDDNILDIYNQLGKKKGLFGFLR